MMDSHTPILIAGPCSAESRDQVLTTAEGLVSSSIDYFRAGIWKPRTQPGAFEGVGSTGLPWLTEVKSSFGLKVCTEVANARHVEEALKAEIDLLWVGARTTTNPFQVQEIADSLKGVEVPVAIKNPTHPDLALWLGAFERMDLAGISNLMAIHRGFAVHGQKKYRNAPLWQIPIDFRNRLPQIPLLNDPSHICGKRELLSEVSQMAMDLAFDGLMVETHPAPDEAWTDAAQQLTPQAFAELISGMVMRSSGAESEADDLFSMRAEINMVDEALIDLFARRMGLSEKIGHYKKAHGLTILQNTRWNELLKRNQDLGLEQGIDPGFTSDVFKSIHQASIAIQKRIMQEGAENEEATPKGT